MQGEPSALEPSLQMCDSLTCGNALDRQLDLEPSADRVDGGDSRVRPRHHRGSRPRFNWRADSPAQIFAQIRRGNGRHVALRYPLARNRRGVLGGRVSYFRRVAGPPDGYAVLVERDDDLWPRQYISRSSMAVDGCAGSVGRYAAVRTDHCLYVRNDPAGLAARQRQRTAQ